MKQVSQAAAHHKEYFERTFREAMQQVGKDAEDVDKLRSWVLEGEYDVVPGLF